MANIEYEVTKCSCPKPNITLDWSATAKLTNTGLTIKTDGHDPLHWGLDPDALLVYGIVEAADGAVVELSANPEADRFQLTIDYPGKPESTLVFRARERGSYTRLVNREEVQWNLG